MHQYMATNAEDLAEIMADAEQELLHLLDDPAQEAARELQELEKMAKKYFSLEAPIEAHLAVDSWLQHEGEACLTPSAEKEKATSNVLNIQMVVETTYGCNHPKRL